MLPECQFSVTERSLQTIKGAHEWAQEHGSLFLHLPAPGDQLKISCFHDHQQKIKFFSVSSTEKSGYPKPSTVY